MTRADRSSSVASRSHLFSRGRSVTALGSFAYVELEPGLRADKQVGAAGFGLQLLRLGLQLAVIPEELRPAGPVDRVYARQVVLDQPVLEEQRAGQRGVVLREARGPPGDDRQAVQRNLLVALGGAGVPGSSGAR